MLQQERREASNEMGSDGQKTICFRFLRQESQSLPTGQTFYSQNGPQEPGVPFRFDCAEIEGPALGVPFPHRAHPGSPECISRWIHKDLPLGFE